MVIEIYISSWIDITDKVLKSYTQKDLLSVEIPKTSTLTLKLDGDKAFFDLISQEHEVRVTDQNVIKYWGFSRGSISKEYIREDIVIGTIRYNDFIKKIEGEHETLHFTNIQIAGNQNALLERLFSKMVELSGIDLTLVSSYEDLSEIDEIYIPEGKILYTFYDFLYYNGLSFYLIGKNLHVHDMLSSPRESWILEDVSTLKENFKFGKEDKNPKVFASRVIADSQEVFNYSEEPKQEILIQGLSFPEPEENLDKLTCNYNIELSENQELISVENVEVSQEVLNDAGDSIEIKYNIEIGQESSDIKFTNNTDDFVFFNNFSLNANLKLQEYFQASSFKANPEGEIKTVFLRDVEHVTRFLKYIVFLNGFETKDYSFYSDALMNLGDMVSVSGLTDPLIITERVDTQDSFGGYDYKGVLYQNIIIDTITKKIAVSKYQKDYITDIYSQKGFVFDGDFNTVLTVRSFLGRQEVVPKTFRWFRDVGLANDTWSKTSQSIEISHEDLNGKASGIFWCETTFPNTISPKKQIFNIAQAESRFLIEYAVSESPELISKSYLGKFKNRFYQFGTEFIEVFKGAFWTTEQPKNPDKYVFIRITNGNVQTVSLYSTPKEKSISLVADNSGIFSVNQRGVVKNQTMNIGLKPTNFFIVPEDVNTSWFFLSTDWIQIVGNSPTLSINHADFSYPLTLKAVYNLGSSTIEDTIQISEIVSTSTNLHLGIQEIAPIDMISIPAGFDEVGQSFVNGDSYVYFDGTDYTPYVFNGSWIKIADAQGNVDTKYADVMIQSANSVTALGRDIPQTSVAVYGYFRNLGAVNAFVENLTAKNLEVGEGGEGFRFDAREDDGSFDGNPKNPKFDVWYNNEIVFQIDPLSGKISFGDTFFYEPSTKSIEANNGNFKINNEGELTVRNASMSNISINGLEATSGTFEGLLNTLTLKTGLAKGEDLLYVNSYTSAFRQLVNMRTDIEITNGFPTGVWINAGGTSGGKQISQIKMEKPYILHHSYTVWLFGLICHRETGFVLSIQVKFSDGTITTLKYIREKKNTRGGSYPEFPTFSNNWQVAVDEGLESYPGDENQNATRWGSDIKMIAIDNFKLPDRLSERLYIDNLPTSLPSESNRVWRDSNGFLRIK